MLEYQNCKHSGEIYCYRLMGLGYVLFACRICEDNVSETVYHNYIMSCAML